MWQLKAGASFTFFVGQINWCKFGTMYKYYVVNFSDKGKFCCETICLGRE